MPFSATIKQQALAFFASQYIIDQPGGCLEPTGYLQYLPPLLDDTAIDSCLTLAVQATALSTLAKERRDTQINLRARRYYASSLLSINSAPTRVEEAAQDETLMAVHILGVYEIINSTTQDLSAMFRHAVGAASPIGLRGPQMVETANGANLFQLKQSIWAICSLMNRKDVFITLPEPEILGKRNSQTTQTMEIIFQVPSILGRFDSIRDREYTILPSPTQIQQLISPLITRALALDNQLDSWCQSLPPTWKPTCTMSSSHLPTKAPPLCPNPSTKTPPPA